MSDRELLERAAKVAGIGFNNKRASHPSPALYRGVSGPIEEQGWWNPLTDDGDALRLLVMLPGCCLCVSEIGATVFLPHEQGAIRLKCDEYANEHGGDLNAAARRAIVRAAAETKP